MHIFFNCVQFSYQFTFLDIDKVAYYFLTFVGLNQNCYWAPSDKILLLFI